MALYVYTRLSIALISGGIIAILGLCKGHYVSNKCLFCVGGACLILVLRLVYVSNQFEGIDAITKKMSGEIITVECLLFQSDPFKSGAYECVIKKITHTNRLNSDKVLMTRLIGKKIKIDGMSVSPSLLYQPVKLQVLFKPIDPPGNPGIFNYQMYAYLHQVIGIGKISESSKIKTLPLKGCQLTLYERMKLTAATYRILTTQTIAERLKHTNAPESYALAIAMLLGYDTLMDEEALEDYYVSGTIHLLTVSGFHFAFMYALLSQTMKIFPIGYRVRFVTSFLFVLFFVWITGTKFAPIRAALSMELFLVAPLLNRRFDLLTSVSIPIIWELLVNPFSISDLSVSLTFLACIGIGFIYPLVTHHPLMVKWLKKCPRVLQGAFNALLISTACSLTTFLVIFQGANRMNYISWLSNLILAFLSSLFMTLQLALLTLNLKSDFYGRLFIWFTSYISNAFEGVNGLYRIMPFKTVVYHPDYSLFAVLVWGVLFFIVIIRGHCKCKPFLNWIKASVTLAVVVLLLVFIDSNMEPKCQVIFWDVGQGDSTLLKIKDHGVVIDAGPPTFNLQNQLFEERINHFEGLLLTHNHMDHVGGMKSLVAFPQTNNKSRVTDKKEWILINGIKEPLKIRTYQYDALPKLIIRGIENMSQSSKPVAGNDSDENQNMTVYWIQYESFDALILGDATGEMENRVTQYLLKQKIDLEVIRTSHHGSSTSNTNSILRRLSPKMAIISVGNNYYGHPSEAALERIYAVTPDVYSTQDVGQIKLIVQSKKVRVSIWGKTSFNWRARVL